MPEQSTLTPQQLADVLMVVLTEVADAMSPDSKTADARLEDIASHLLTMSAGVPAGPVQEALSALAKNLIQTEEGSQLGGE